MNIEFVQITNCPKCGVTHRYKLEVKRAIIIKLFRLSDMEERSRSVKITRFFTCPATNQDFQATFTLTDSSHDRIENVIVAGVVD